MTPRSLFAVIIKVIAIYLLIFSLLLIPQFFGSIMFWFQPSFGTPRSGEILTGFLIIILVVGFYIFFIRTCLFKTDWIIDKLRLDRGFSEEKFEINIHRSTVLKIAVIVIGTMIIIDYLPFLCQQAFQYFSLSTRDTGFKENPASKGIVLDIARLFVGFFLVTSSRLVVNFIERKRKGPVIKPAETTEE